MLLEQLKKDKLEALRQGDKIKKDILSVAIAECTKKTKEPDDIFVEKVLAKLIKSNNETLSKAHYDHLIEENVILLSYLPKMLTEDEICSIIKTNQFISVPQCMSYFKANHLGKYDGKILLELFVKEI